MIERKSTAVLIIDAQLCAFDGARSPPCYDASVLLDNLVLLIKTARKNEVPLIFIQHRGSKGATRHGDRKTTKIAEASIHALGILAL